MMRTPGGDEIEVDLPPPPPPVEDPPPPLPPEPALEAAAESPPQATEPASAEATPSLPELPTPKPRAVSATTGRPAGDPDEGLPPGLTVVPDRLPGMRRALHAGRPLKFMPMPPEWRPSPAPDKLLRAYMLRFWEQTMTPLQEREGRNQIRNLTRDLVESIEMTLGQGQQPHIMPDFLPAVFQPLFNDVFTWTVRIMRERLAYRALWFLHKWGYPRVPPPHMLLRVIPDSDPIRETERRETRKALKMNMKQESWMPPKSKKLMDETAVEGEIFEENDRDPGDDDEDDDELPEVEPQRASSKAVRASGAQEPARPRGRPLQEVPSAGDVAAGGFPEMPPAHVGPPSRRNADPVQAWLPSGYKLRLWRKGEPGELDVHLRDFPTEALRRFTGLPDVFEQVIRRAYGPFPGASDMTYVVCFVNPKGVEGPHHDYRLGAPPVEGLGVMGAPVNPMGAPVASPQQPSAQQVPVLNYPPPTSGASGLLQTVEEVMAVEDRFNRRQQAQAPAAGPTQPSFSPELEELRRRSEMLELELMQMRSERQQGNAPTPASHDVGIAQVLSQTLQRVLPPAGMGQAGAMTPQGPSFMELMSLMEQQRQSTITLMTSLMPKPTGPDPMLVEMLKRMDERMERLEESREQGPNDIEKFAHQAQVVRALLGVDVNGPLFKQKETEGLLGVLKEFIDKGPEILREYQNTMRTTAQLQYGVNVPQPQLAASQQAQRQQAQVQAQQAQLAAQAQAQQDAQLAQMRRAQRRNSLPPGIRKAIEELIKAATSEQMVTSFGQLQEEFAKHHEAEQKQREKIQAAGQPVPESVFGPVIAGIEQLFTRSMTVAAENATPEEVAHAAAERQAGREALTQYLVQLLDFIGYGQEATPPKVAAVTKALFDRLDEEAAEDEEDAELAGEDDDGEEDEGEPAAEAAPAAGQQALPIQI